ncbi:MAG: biopolymer transporter ExbD [Candidatus Omnitrophica bacterium]|nr:biopolymer transporter ExbD [Candidatus Omnitrophota bacterium]
MRIQRTYRPLNGIRMLWALLANVIVLSLAFVMLGFYFTRPVPFGIKFTKAVTSDAFSSGNVVVVVTSENVFYVAGHVTTLAELKEMLSGAGGAKRQMLIKADRRSSLGRIVELMNLARGLGVEKINIATDREE